MKPRLDHSVQGQLARKRQVIRHTAELITKADPSYVWIQHLLIEQGIDLARGILVKLDDLPDQDGISYTGLWLTDDEQFYLFKATVPWAATDHTVYTLDEYHNATNNTSVLYHLKGTGESFGALALEVLHELFPPRVTTPQL